MYVGLISCMAMYGDLHGLFLLAPILNSLRLDEGLIWGTVVFVMFFLCVSAAPILKSPQFIQFLFPGSHTLVLGTKISLLNLLVVLLDFVLVSS